uniref:Uncharacterized protein n=1 Tax=Aegilops tauschii subsp. strangulata TaxID=200361 RepID=A0A453F154_AEGTS
IFSKFWETRRSSILPFPLPHLTLSRRGAKSHTKSLASPRARAARGPVTSSIQRARRWPGEGPRSSSPGRGRRARAVQGREGSGEGGRGWSWWFGARRRRPPRERDPALLRRPRQGNNRIFFFHQQPYDRFKKMEDSTDEQNGEGAARVIQGHRRPRKKQVQEGRNRASPARLVKLNKSLDQRQKDLIETYHLGGILKIEATTMPADLSRWVMHIYDPDSECIVENIIHANRRKLMLKYVVYIPCVNSQGLLLDWEQGPKPWLKLICSNFAGSRTFLGQHRSLR